MDYVALGDESDAFTRGGNRLCFIDPRDSNRCIKVLRPDRSPEIRRRQKGFPKNLRSLRSFDENIEEFSVWQSIERLVGEPAFTVISRCYGFVETNYGPGLVMALIKDSDGKISKTLKQVIWENGLTKELKNTIDNFAARWIELCMPSKKLLLHNMLLQSLETENRIYVIDGLGWSSLFPMDKFNRRLAQMRAKKKVKELEFTIEELLRKKEQGINFGYHGWMEDGQRAIK